MLNGSCSMHAVFGRPHRRELFCENARQIIVAAFAKGYTMAGTREHIDVLLSGWWAELRAAIVNDTYKHNEVGMLWHTRDKTKKNNAKTKLQKARGACKGKNENDEDCLRRHAETSSPVMLKKLSCGL